jgi:small GTP-binding protein
MARLGDPNALKTLRAIADNPPSEEVKKAAQDVITRLTSGSKGAKKSGQTAKVVIAGPFGAGKTTFISTLSEIDVVSTEKAASSSEAASKAQSTIAMDYGRISVDEALTVYLFGTPGQRRFDFMWEIIAEGMQGFIILVDSTDPTMFKEAISTLAIFRNYASVPFLIALNKQDKADAISPDEFRKLVELDDSIKILPSIATDYESAKGIVLELLHLILEEME